MIWRRCTSDWVSLYLPQVLKFFCLTFRIKSKFLNRAGELLWFRSAYILTSCLTLYSNTRADCASLLQETLLVSLFLLPSLSSPPSFLSCSLPLHFLLLSGFANSLSFYWMVSFAWLLYSLYEKELLWCLILCIRYSSWQTHIVQ